MSQRRLHISSSSSSSILCRSAAADQPFSSEEFSRDADGVPDDESPACGQPRDGDRFFALVRRLTAAVRRQAVALVCAAIVALGLLLGANGAGHARQQVAATQSAPVTTAASAERTTAAAWQGGHQRQRPASYSLQDRALLLDSQRQARLRPPDSPVWISSRTPLPPGELPAAPRRQAATSFASIGTKVGIALRCKVRML